VTAHPRPGLRAKVISTDGMTADYYPFGHAFRGRVANRIIHVVRGQLGDLRHHVEAARHNRVGMMFRR
jgi:hypothetical protein